MSYGISLLQHVERNRCEETPRLPFYPDVIFGRLFLENFPGRSDSPEKIPGILNPFFLEIPSRGNFSVEIGSSSMIQFDSRSFDELVILLI